MRYEVVNVKGNSVRLRFDSIAFDFKVIVDECGKKHVIKPKDVFFTVEDFRLIVRLVLNAYEKEVACKEKLNYGTQEERL